MNPIWLLILGAGDPILTFWNIFYLNSKGYNGMDYEANPIIKAFIGSRITPVKLAFWTLAVLGVLVLAIRRVGDTLTFFAGMYTMVNYLHVLTAIKVSQWPNRKN